MPPVDVRFSMDYLQSILVIHFENGLPQKRATREREDFCHIDPFQQWRAFLMRAAVFDAGHRGGKKDLASMLPGSKEGWAEEGSGAYFMKTGD